MDMLRRMGESSTVQSAEGSHDDTRILLAARADLTQFAPLYERYFPRVYGYCLRRVENAEAAEDLTSLIFTRALTSLHEYKGGSVPAWLFRIAHNAVANHYRSRRNHISLERSAVDLLDDREAPTERLEQAEQQQAIRSLVAALPDGEQELLALKLAGELTAEEIGVVVGKKAGAVRVELHRIIKRLRAQYEGLP
jgi:RNA polymerase sigma-70 factor (ECF subfamily)